LLQLILLNTSSRRDSPFYERLRLHNYHHLLRLALRHQDLVFREQMILKMTAAGIRDLQEVAQRYSQMPPTTTANWARQIWASSRYSFGNAPAFPVLLINSEGDRLVSPNCSRRIAQRWRAPLKTHPLAGHDLPLMAPDWLLEQVVQFQKTCGNIF
jgi:pimeloyl-ACP methyl ester carboxylesterase